MEATYNHSSRTIEYGNLTFNTPYDAMEWVIFCKSHAAELREENHPGYALWKQEAQAIESCVKTHFSRVETVSPFTGEKVITYDLKPEHLSDDELLAELNA